MEKAKEDPRKIRRWLAWKFVQIARWIYPRSDEVKEFLKELVVDELIYKKFFIRMDPRLGEQVEKLRHNREEVKIN